MGSRRFTVLFLVVLLAAGCSKAPLETSTTEPEAIERIVDLPSDERYGAVYRLFEQNVAVDVLVTELGDALDTEVSSPTPGTGRTWFSASEVLLQTYATGMGVPDAIPALRDRLEKASAAARPWYVIALAYAGDTEIADEVVELLRSRPTPAVAVHLMNIVGLDGISDAAPILMEYLGDDLSVPAGDLQGAPDAYPLRDEASGALRRLGYTVYAPPDRPGEYQVFQP